MSVCGKETVNLVIKHKSIWAAGKKLTDSEQSVS